MSLLYRLCYLFSAFGPLYLLVAVSLMAQHSWENGDLLTASLIPAYVSAVAFFGSVAIFLCLRAGFQAKSPTRAEVEPMESLDEGVLGYLISYLPPLMIDDLHSISKVAPALVFYIVLLIVVACNDKLYVNPYFLLFRYRLRRVKLPSGRQVVVITNKIDLRIGETVTLYEIQPSALYFATR